MPTSKTWQTRRKRMRSDAIAREFAKESDDLLHSAWTSLIAKLPLAEETRVRRLTSCACRPCRRLAARRSSG